MSTEREAFEKWVAGRNLNRANPLTRLPSGEYQWSAIEESWVAWQARAALAREKAATVEPLALSAECYISDKHLKNLRDPEVGICVIERAKSARATTPLFTLEAITSALAREKAEPVFICGPMEVMRADQHTWREPTAPAEADERPLE